MDVTVVIPCHNQARWLRAAVSSAHAQAPDPGPGIVVVDDGSSDHPSNALADLGCRLEWIRNPEARGANVARNQGLAAVNTTWVQFLDADDELLPDKLANQLRIAERQQAELVYGPVRESFHPRGAPAASHEIDHMPDVDAPLSVQWLRWQFAHTATVLWRTEALRRIGGWNPDQPCCQDNELCLRAIQAGLQTAYCPHVGVRYRVWSEDTLSRRDPTRVLRERTRLMGCCLADLERRGALTPEHLAAAGQASFEIARRWANHDLSGALSYAREQQEQGWWKVAGPAAAGVYGPVARTLGFGAAERFARCKRAVLGRAG